MKNNMKNNMKNSNLTFSLALEALKKGHKVAREGWNEKGMFLSFIILPNLFIKWFAEYTKTGIIISFSIKSICVGSVPSCSS